MIINYIETQGRTRCDKRKNIIYLPIFLMYKIVNQFLFQPIVKHHLF